jgi:hypothetical protein
MVPVPPEPGKVNCWTAWARQFGSSIIRCARNEHTSIGLSDSSVAHRMRPPAKMAELEKGDLFLSFAIAADSILVLQGTSASPSSAQNTASSAVPTTANARRLKCTKCGAGAVSVTPS